LVYRIF